MKYPSPISIEALKQLEPISSLSEERLQELIPLVYVEQLPIGGSLFREGDLDGQAVYLLAGSIQLSSSDGKINRSLTEHQEELRFPLDDSQPRQASCSALTRVEVLRIDNSVLDYMMMWDQMALSEDQPADAPPSAKAQSQAGERAAGPAATRDTETKTPVQQSASQDGQQATATESEGVPQADTEPVSEAKSKPEPGPESQPEAVAKEAASPEAQSDAEPVATKDSGKGASPKVPVIEDRSWIRKMRHIMAFKSMPPANIKRLLEKMESIEVSQGETILHQGEPGEYYYVLTEGEAEVTRIVKLADLGPGRSFGEEALLAGNRRNATVTMKTDGVVMRLSKDDFNELLQEPLLNRVSPEEARQQVLKGAIWLDVRHAREFYHSHLPHSLNVPLHELRMRIHEFNKQEPLICYCSTGRRSAAAAFLLVQKGFNACVLNGGIKVMAQDLVSGT